MTRRKHRGQRLTGLFTWQAGNEVTDDDTDNPLARTCTYCHAGIGDRCTRPGRRGRRIPITGYHHSRNTQLEDR